MFMGQEEAGLALGLSLGSGAGHHRHLLQPKEAAPPELYLSLSLAGAGAVKREEEERALIYCSAASSAADDQAEGYNSSSGGGGSRKKLRLTKEQTALLEDHFKEQSTLSHKQKASLARQVNLRPRQVEVWFQNRRARTKLKQTEVDCELLKRCCDTLTEENRRLHRELQHLRALHHHHHHHPAAATFFMPSAATAASVCPSCAGAPPAHAADRPAAKRSFFATKSGAC